MSRIRIRRPSPAMVVALVALFVALAGTASAALVITGRNVRNSSLTGADVRNGTLSGHDIRNGTIRPGDVANGSLTRADINPSSLGPRAESLVSATGVANTILSRDIGTVTHPHTGVYCFYMKFQPANVQATLNAGGPAGATTVKATVLRDDHSGNACPGPESASVRVWNANTKGVLQPSNAGFYVAFN